VRCHLQSRGRYAIPNRGDALTISRSDRGFDGLSSDPEGAGEGLRISEAIENF
jgi:hypothetical protein